ncbi:hypothetical protein LJC46_07550 [Desulfovibrio sp. OttesenSCG-928-G15]|nr:hypothetical protein [Desulfovibrio sp. OttesenSCG-928-G15]
MSYDDEWKDDWAEEEDAGKTEPCSECKGSGRMDCPMEYGRPQHPESCPACGGYQKVECEYCEGTGIAPEPD